MISSLKGQSATERTA